MMKKIAISLLSLIIVTSSFAQNDTYPTPAYQKNNQNKNFVTVGSAVFTAFAANEIRKAIKKHKAKKAALKKQITPLYGGRYDEIHIKKRYQKVGRVLIDTKTRKIAAFTHHDTLQITPEVLSRSWSVDPEARLYPDISPYAFVANSPIQFIDPSGAVIVDPKTGETVVSVNGQWKTASGGDVSKQFIKNTQPVLDRLTASAVGTKLVEQLQSIRTKVTIDLSDKPNLQALKNGGNSKIRTPDGEFNNIGSDGLFDEVVITPALDKIEAQAKVDGIDFSEKLIQTISVESGHIGTAAQINKEKAVDFNFFTSPTVTTNIYGPLLQNAVELGIQYRQEQGQTVDQSSNLPIQRVNKATGSTIPEVALPKKP